MDALENGINSKPTSNNLVSRPPLMKMYILHTSLDKRHSSFDFQRKKEADRLAKEIEGTVSSNFHVAEERSEGLGRS